MFWKTMAILWTVLLLILAGAAVQFVRTAQPGSSKVGTSPKGPAKGTQATVILSNVPCKEAVLMPALLNLKKTDTATGESAFSQLPKDLQDKSLKDLHRCISVRHLEGDIAAIDVHGCKSDKQAWELARAIAESYIQFIRELKTKVSKGTIKRFTDERDRLRSRRKALLHEIVRTRGGSSVEAMQERRKLLSIKLETLVQEILKAEDTKSQAESALKVHEEMQKKGSLADSHEVRMALEMDSILQTLKILLVEVKAGLQVLPPNRDKKTAIAVLEVEIKIRRKKVLESQIATIGRERWMSREAATLRLMDLKERKNATRDEIRDANRALSTIDSLESEKKCLEEMLSKIEDRLWKIQRDLLEGVPEVIGILP